MKLAEENLQINELIRNINKTLNKIGFKSELRYEPVKEIIYGEVNEYKIEMSVFATSVEYTMKSIFRRISEMK